ncbi:hypothetical protein PIB30_115249, partial [Stylosanthes scabra]|nr:hypothetical protein [Stylosanthes scabra]
DHTQGAETDYSTRLATNQKLDGVLRELCIPEATWKLGTGQNPGYVYRANPIPEEDLHLYYNQQVAFFGQFFESNPQVE